MNFIIKKRKFFFYFSGTLLSSSSSSWSFHTHTHTNTNTGRHNKVPLIQLYLSSFLLSSASSRQQSFLERRWYQHEKDSNKWVPLFFRFPAHHHEWMNFINFILSFSDNIVVEFFFLFEINKIKSFIEWMNTMLHNFFFWMMIIIKFSIF